MAKSVQQFITKIGKGMAMSNQYEVKFEINPAGLRGALSNALSSRASSAFFGDGLITLLCNEAQLPNVSSLTGQTNGVYLGETQVNYAYGRLFTDISLGWMCDVDMTPLKFLQEWHNYIYSSGQGNLLFSTNGAQLEDSSVRSNISRALPTRVRYPDEYQATIRITKLDLGKGNDRKSMSYVLLNAFPHSIDATPLSYGASQVVNVSASFYYSKYYVSYDNEV